MHIPFLFQGPVRKKHRHYQLPPQGFALVAVDLLGQPLSWEGCIVPVVSDWILQVPSQVPLVKSSWPLPSALRPVLLEALQHWV